MEYLLGEEAVAMLLIASEINFNERWRKYGWMLVKFWYV